MTAPRPIGLILAGGRGSRFGGRDKAWLRLQGQPLLCHAWRRLASQADTVVVASQRHRWAYRRLGIALIDDHAAAPGRGPMSAVAAALVRWPRARIALLPVDAPQAPANYVARLAAALDAGAPAAAVFDGQRRQPLFAVLSGLLADSAVRALQARNMPSMQGWLDQVGAAWVDFSGVPDAAAAFANINTPSDLERLARTVSGGS